MPNFSELTQYFTLVVLIACLIAGYVIKHTFDMIPNKYIPTVLAVIGVVLNVGVNGFSIESIVYGALTGLASTGMHQAFTKFIEKNETE